MKKKLTKKLTLHRETLRELTDPRLDKVAGGMPTVPAHMCLSEEISCVRTCTC